MLEITVFYFNSKLAAGHHCSKSMQSLHYDYTNTIFEVFSYKCT